MRLFSGGLEGREGEESRLGKKVTQFVINEHHEEARLKASGDELFQERDVLARGEHLFRVLSLARELELDRHSGLVVGTQEADIDLPLREVGGREAEVRDWPLEVHARSVGATLAEMKAEFVLPFMLVPEGVRTSDASSLLLSFPLVKQNRPLWRRAMGAVTGRQATRTRRPRRQSPCRRS